MITGDPINAVIEKIPRPAQRLPPPPVYFDPARQSYLIQNTRRQWIPITEVSLRRHLRPHFAQKDAREIQSPLDDHLNRLQLECDVSYAGPLAGAGVGLREQQGRRILVTDAPLVIPAKPGEWPVLGKVLENLLTDAVLDQRPYLFGWLKIARTALVTGKPRPGQGLVMAGPRDCGKSLVQNLITLLLGGRAAKPYGWMTGATDFNAELFGAEHLMIEDECASTDLRARRNFGAQLKSVTVNQVQKCHQKNRTALSLEPLWRVTVTVNDEPENLMVLPPIDDSIEDKLILLRANCRPMPMPTGTQAQRDAFMAVLVGELPAFCAFLESWQIPAELASERFGITHWHHPDLLAAIDELAPEMRLLQLIDAVCFRNESPRRYTAQELEAELTGSEATAYEARRLLYNQTICGTYLGRLAKKHPDRVKHDRTAFARHWLLWKAGQ